MEQFAESATSKQAREFGWVLVDLARPVVSGTAALRGLLLSVWLFNAPLVRFVHDSRESAHRGRPSVCCAGLARALMSCIALVSVVLARGSVVRVPFAHADAAAAG